MFLCNLRTIVKFLTLSGHVSELEFNSLSLLILKTWCFGYLRKNRRQLQRQQLSFNYKKQVFATVGYSLFYFEWLLEKPFCDGENSFPY